MPKAYRIFRAISLLLLILQTQKGFAVTVKAYDKLSPSKKIELDGLGKCSTPGKECPRLSIDDIVEVVYLPVNTTYSLSDDQENLTPVTEPGLLVTYTKTEVESGEKTETRRFFPMAKVELSQDQSYYMCDEGAEFTFTVDTSIEEAGLDPKIFSPDFLDTYKPTSYTCKCFWAPESLYIELDLDKVAKKSTVLDEDSITSEVIDDMTDLVDFADIGGTAGSSATTLSNSPGIPQSTRTTSVPAVGGGFSVPSVIGIPFTTEGDVTIVVTDPQPTPLPAVGPRDGGPIPTLLNKIFGRKPVNRKDKYFGASK